MLQKKPVFPHVIEMNYQAGERLGCNVYLVYDDAEWVLIDIGFEDTVDEIVQMIRQLDFPLSQCKAIVATHADVDHIQGLAKAKQLLKAPVIGHKLAAEPLATGDPIKTFAKIDAQDINMPMPPVKLDKLVEDGDVIPVGKLQLEVWHTPGHTDSQLSFRLGNLLLSGDNIYRDGCVGAIDAHHGSDIPSFIASLKRIRASDVEWLLPSHGPIFRKENALLDRTIGRLESYLHMADFGTCAVDWPLMDDWDQELADGQMPTDEAKPKSRAPSPSGKSSG
ncbi:MAG TPA: MBL fold metallo-hydrolase [Pirellulales bacterium]|jgi:glyoxylase-like metal-dependent hydrolase (beta-lactamase superfamily II)